MTIDRIILANVRRTVRQAVRDLLFDPNINLIDVGYPERNGNLVQDELAMSIWLEQQSRHAVGLHFAGSYVPGRGLALDMPTVLEALNVNLATDVSASIAHSHQSCPRSTEVDGRGFTLCPDITSLQEMVK